MSMTITLEPIEIVCASRDSATDDQWDSVPNTIELDASFSADALIALDTFSHTEIIYIFDRVVDEKIVRGSRHPRGKTSWPNVGIFAQRAKDRPNRIGATIVRIVEVAGLTVRVAGMDAIDGTLVLDIKPVMREFLPRGEEQQPSWATELMQNYG